MWSFRWSLAQLQVFPLIFLQLNCSTKHHQEFQVSVSSLCILISYSLPFHLEQQSSSFCFFNVINWWRINIEIMYMKFQFSPFPKWLNISSFSYIMRVTCFHLSVLLVLEVLFRVGLQEYFTFHVHSFNLFWKCDHKKTRKTLLNHSTINIQ